MRLILRSQVRAATAPAASVRLAGIERRAWIEAMFAEHLPRSGPRREEAIAALANNGSVWTLLHQARHSMAETSATIERLARSALDPETPRAA